MPLDPLVQAFLDQLNAQPSPPMWQLTPDQAREMFVAMMNLVGPKDVPIGKTENISIPGPAGDIPARIYSPVAAGSDAQPTLVFFHGGGWVIGDLETHDGLCRMFANEGGLKVIAVDYRRAPENPFPAAIEDAFAAVSWIEANAAKLGVDPNSIAVGGDSAGGGLSASLAQMAKTEGAPHIGFQLLMFPVTHVGGDTPSLHDFAKGYFLETETLEWFYKCYAPNADDRNDPRASPLLAEDVSGLPDAYVMLAGYDPLHDEGLRYAEKLRGAGAAVTVADYPDLVHDFIYMQAVLPQAHAAVSAAAKAVAAALGKK
ncbi:MAG TPA: alpha/beta hydrolase [Rhizomicrobium sp.]|nr:alpha/beta hydrolase [Rhizomicrobium sp.]